MASAPINGAARIADAHHTFQAKPPAPFGFQIGGIIPAHALVEHGGKIIADRNGDIGALPDMVF